MSYRRRQQLHRVATRTPRAGAVATPPNRRDRPGTQAPPRQAVGPDHADPPGGSQGEGLGWSRRIELVSVLAASLAAVVGLWYSNAQVRDQLQVSREELKVSREGQITGRYTAAVAQLGDKALDVRLGGIYALQRIMQDSRRDQPTIINVLSAYVRTHTNQTPGKAAASPSTVRAAGKRAPASDIAAALTVLADRNPGYDRSQRPDLRDAHLGGANLSDADLRGAHLNDADLRDADLRGVHLGGANLSDADLGGADLSDADLRGADLINADLRSAYLINADLRSAHLLNADLDSAYLDGVNLGGADLDVANLGGAYLNHAKLTAKQVLTAHITKTTKLPPELARREDVKAHIAKLAKARG